jgi:hypothetical protein
MTLKSYKDEEKQRQSNWVREIVGDNREKWGDFWEKLIAINRNILSRSL